MGMSHIASATDVSLVVEHMQQVRVVSLHVRVYEVC